MRNVASSTLRLVVFAIVCSHAAATVGFAEQIHDAGLGFSLTIPDQFQRDAQLVAANPDFVHGFRRPGTSGVDTMVIVERMRGTIGRERLDPSKAPPGFKGRVLTVYWQGFELDALEVPEQVDGTSVVNYNVQVPLKPEAIQIRVVGAPDDAPQMRALLAGILGSLNGESNWLRASAPPAVAASPHYGTVILSVTVVGVVAGLAILWALRRRSRRGMVLLLAVLIYAASWAMAPGQTREMRAAVGGVRMLGFLGVLLGLFDLFRHPAGKRPAEGPVATVDPDRA